jgi:hypothetical protein
MKTLKSIAMTLAIVVNAIIVSFAQTADTSSDANQIFTMTARFAAVHPAEAYGFFYGKEALNELLTVKDIGMVYVFNALDEGGMNKVVLKAADPKGNILISTDPYDEVKTCPPFCPKSQIAAIGKPITEENATRLIETFQMTYRNREKAQLFDKSSFEKVLAQKGAEGLYLGHAINDREEQIMILAGVDFYGNIMWDGIVVNESTPIPAFQSIGYPANDIAAKK